LRREEHVRTKDKRRVRHLRATRQNRFTTPLRGTCHARCPSSARVILADARRRRHTRNHVPVQRAPATGSPLTDVAGHAEFFFVPVNWLQTAIAVEHLNPINRASTYRVSPSAEVRLTPHFRLQFSTRNVYAATDSRTYSVQLQVKAQ
jgi:hypothetical protein